MSERDPFSIDKEICMNFEEGREDFQGAVVPPIYGNTLFTYDSFEELADADNHLNNNYVYRRGPNPTVEVVERKLAALERGESCKTFSSGMAAISAVFMNSVQQGDHILIIGHVYATTLHLIKYMEKFGVTHSIIFETEKENIEEALQPNTTVIYFESPSDIVLHIIDLESVTKIAQERKIRTIIDNTWATPLFQKPLQKGIDIVMHSASKYLGGHSDCMGGVVVSKKEIMDTIFNKELLLMGASLSPYDASLLIRGLRTLPFRMKIHEANARKIAAFLQEHPAVETVYHPSLPTHPNYELVKRQMSGFSGLLSFTIKNQGFDNLVQLMNPLQLFKIGVSWGSFESLIWSPFYGTNEAQLKEERIPINLVRLAVGLEEADLLINDLERGLDALL